MDTLTNWLMAMVQPVVVRVMTSLGLSVITFKGVESAFAQARGYVMDAVNSFPASVLSMMGLFGIDTGLALILGAMSFALTLWALRKAFSFFGLGGLVS
ncbi:DUF2523 domain-containing protein [Polaromonas sp.]|uniref:DUF2523 domain-containing protein n=1 Tax=Polaromonas sp. TaxID=1869339 RepID=UPI003CC37DD7